MKAHGLCFLGCFYPIERADAGVFKNANILPRQIAGGVATR
jgi:hypothetical protein